ncbi:MAG TPA: HNH endonuclease [Hanamia sp.]|jgi:HNH endonuclease/NUMOD4 motif|nr:HNH endonuclease [Hanamia sp.]
MIKKINGETWKPLRFDGWKLMRNHYALSSHGRAASYREDVNEDGKLLSGSLTSGYKTLNLHVQGTSGTIYFHREIAKLFNKKSSPKEKFVIHLNYDKTDNHIKNLKWVTQKEAIAHQQQSPHKLAYKKVQTSRTKGLKLNATQVKAIKATLENPRRKLTHLQIAEKYDVSPMTIYRIKSGESWSRI